MHFQPTYAHIYTYLHIIMHILLHEDPTFQDNCTHNMHMGGHSMDTRVHFLQSVRLHVKHTPFEFVQVLSVKVDLHIHK